MRDIKRIRKFCNELANIWESQCPDWRFSQLILNVLNSDEMDDVMAFYVEDDKMMEFIKSYFKMENQIYKAKAEEVSYGRL